MKLKTVLFVLVLACSPVLTQAAEMVINRYAIVAGANDGGKDRLSLKYARSDARLVSKVFSELGGVDGTRNTVLIEPTPDEILGTIKNLNNTIISNTQSGVRNEFIFYYSGHSDENGLLLGEDTLDYKRLRNAVKEIDADVKVAILDSCASGAFTRIKGGKRRPTFLVDESSKVKGHAFLASSSAEESAQESDVIGGSYFTHYLISALRGAADTTNDKRVTLNEAYQFAFHETLARTENSLFGAQHAAYDIQLAGAGDLVLTDLRSANATLGLPKSMSGRIYIRNSEGNLVVELNKIPERAIQLAMEPGEYSAIIDSNGNLSKAEFRLVKNDQFVFDPSKTTPVSRQDSIARGNTTEFNKNDYVDVDLKVHAFPEMVYRSQELNGKKENVKVDLNLLVGQTDRVDGFAGGLFVSYVREDLKGVQASTYINFIGGNLDGGRGTGIANVIQGNVTGGQGAGGFNITMGSLQGGQGAGGFNVNLGDVDGGMGAGGFNVIKGNLKGGAGAAGFNVVKGNVKGGVGAAGFNVINGNLNGGAGAAGFNVIKGNVEGGLGAAGFNVVKGNIDGGMGAAGFNIIKGDLTGGMGSAGFNIVNGDVEGVQVSTALNVARTMSGVQVGMLNVAKEFEGVPVGMLSLYGNGRKDPSFWLDDSRYGHIALKSGTHSIYNMLGIAFLDRDGELEDVRVQWGIGKHFKINSWAFVESDIVFSNSVRRIDIDVDNKWLKDKIDYDGYCVFCLDSNNTLSLRVTGGTTLARYLKAYAGMSINMLYDRHPDKDFSYGTIEPWQTRYLGVNMNIWPGFYAGLEF